MSEEDANKNHDNDLTEYDKNYIEEFLLRDLIPASENGWKGRIEVNKDDFISALKKPVEIWEDYQKHVDYNGAANFNDVVDQLGQKLKNVSENGGIFSTKGDAYRRLTALVEVRKPDLLTKEDKFNLAYTADYVDKWAATERDIKKAAQEKNREAEEKELQDSKENLNSHYIGKEGEYLVYDTNAGKYYVSTTGIRLMDEATFRSEKE